MIPNAISMSLFVEGSHGEALKRTVVKSLVTIFSQLVPAAAGCSGWSVLSMRLVGLVVLSGLVFGLVVELGYLSMTMLGVVGIGYAWIVANWVGSVCVGVTVWREG